MNLVIKDQRCWINEEKTVLFIALLFQWPRFNVVISSCWVKDDRLVVGPQNQRETYPSNETWVYNVRLLDAKTDKHENEVIGQKCN